MKVSLKSTLRLLPLALFAAMALQAGGWWGPAVPVGATAVGITVDKTVTNYIGSVVTNNSCGSTDPAAYYEQTLTIFPAALNAGTFAIGPSLAVDVKVTFDQGVLVSPGLSQFVLFMALSPVGTQFNGGVPFSGAVMTLTGSNITTSINASAGSGFVTGFGPYAGSQQIYTGDAFLTNPSLPGRIDSFRTTFTTPADLPSGTVEVSRILIAAVTTCAVGHPTTLLSLPPCQPGFFSATGNAPCTPAPAGKYVDTTGATEATPCALGYYQPSTGQTSCIAALAGSFVGTTGASGSTLCSKGYYQPDAGQPSCIAAAAGSYVDTSGATSATQCAAGTFSSTTASQGCQTCPSGTTSGAGASACTPLDTTPPETSISFSPPSPTNDNTPGFSFSSSELGSTFRCRMDLDPFASCTSPFIASTLVDGPHTFSVHATDAAGNDDPTPASSTLTIDTRAPLVTIVSITPNPTNGSTTVRWKADEAGLKVAMVNAVSDCAGGQVVSGSVQDYPTANVEFDQFIPASLITASSTRVDICFTDVARNGNSTSGNILRDTSAPTATIVSSSVSANGDASVIWKASENGTATFRVGGTDCTNGAPAVSDHAYATAPNNTTTVIPDSFLAAGANLIRLCFKDTATNAAAPVTTTVTRQTAKLEVRKAFIGTGIAGVELRIDGVTKATVGAAGGTTNEVTVKSGTRAVSEYATALTPTTYGTNITCKPLNGLGPASTNATGTTANVTLAANADVVCVITNVQIPAQCAAMAPFANVFVGTVGFDTINGTEQNDLVAALGGAVDTINTLGGRDCVLGGGGADTINLGEGDDAAFGEDGSDNIQGGGGNDYIDGGPGIDTVNGGPGTDTCIAVESKQQCEP